jgi:predicted RNA binding protein YcfA (HicA-like mRNA interferase family)
MPKLKILFGKEVVRIFEKVGFAVIVQKGSHVKLRRIRNNEKQTLTIPNHDEIDKGTLKAIFNQALRYVAENELREHFYSD